MDNIVHATGLHKNYGSKKILNDINLTVLPGEIIGLIGPNGAGKTTLLKTILGLAPFEGDLNVLGMNPKKHRNELMKKVSFIADTAILPSWLKVREAISFMEGTHPRFSREKAEAYLESTNISLSSKISQLSKGMITKTHLSLVMAIESELLVLDEPTLGLDILKRKEFYQQLLGDYFDKDKTIIITTHQVEEVENILTRAIFIDDGELILNNTTDQISNSFYEVTVSEQLQQEAESKNPIHKMTNIKGTTYTYRDIAKEELANFGKISTPTLADIFVAMVTENGGKNHEI